RRHRRPVRLLSSRPVLFGDVALVKQARAENSNYQVMRSVALQFPKDHDECNSRRASHWNNRAAASVHMACNIEQSLVSDRYSMVTERFAAQILYQNWFL